MKKPSSVYRYKKIAALLASATIITGSPTIIDRMANALTSEQALRSLSDALRIIISIKQSGSSLTTLQEKDENVLITKVEENVTHQYTIPYGLPNESDIGSFIDYVSEDISMARKLGTLAANLVAGALGR